MSMLEFAEDFTRLVMRYTKIRSPNFQSNEQTISVAPLTHKEIMLAVHHVLYGLGIKDSDDNSDHSQIKTSDNELAISIPAAPIKSEINYKQDDKNACSSQDAQLVDLGSSISNTPQKASGNEAEISSNVQNEKNFTPRSNPTICVSNIGRSDTFVCEDNQKAKNNDLEDVFENSFTNTVVSDLCDKILEPLDEIWKSLMSIVTKMDNLKTSLPQLNKRTRQSSLNFSFHGSSKDAMKTQHPTKIRRSITALARTPTTSFVSLAVQKEDRRKSTGAIVCNENGGKSNESKKIAHATSNLNLSVFNKTPTNSSKIAKNPKYAHIRSTIPKPISQSKKKEQ